MLITYKTIIENHNFLTIILIAISYNNENLYRMWFFYQK